MGVLVDEHVPATEVLYYIRAMIETFCQHGNYENRAKARTRFMQETMGVDGLKAAFLENVAKVKEKGGLDLHVEAKRVVAQKQPGLYAVAYHPIGGCLPAGKPAELLTLVREIPDAECRIAPHETIYIINLTADEAEKVLEATNDGAQSTFENSVACPAVPDTRRQPSVSRERQSLLTESRSPRLRCLWVEVISSVPQSSGRPEQ